MRLLHLITRLSLGGSARNTIDSAAAAVREGYDTILATGPSGDELDVTHLATESGCRLAVIPSLRREIAPLRDLRALLEIIGLIRRERVSIVHTHTSKAGFLGRLAARMANVPVVIHTPHGHIFYAYYGEARTSFFIALERWSATFSDALVALTEDDMREHLERRIGTRDQYRVIPSGVDLEAFRKRAPDRDVARSELGWSLNERILVGVGRLVPIKGFDVAVRALTPLRAVFPKIRLVLVGDGPERSRLEHLAAASGNLSNLTITGATRDVAPFLAAADVVIAPSRNEGMGRVLVEAMALGKPIVASRVGGVPSVVSDGRSGALVPPDDPAELARTVIELLQDPTRMEAYAKAAAERAERFSLPLMQQGLLKLYRELAAKKGLSPIPSTEASRSSQPSAVLSSSR
jgi:glycosyltransferase involved in cell wall biosynthesis